MRSPLVTLFLLAVLPGAALSQTVRGRVLDSATDAPVAGATVRLLGEGGGSTIAGNAGEFEVEVEAAGVFRLQVERIGYPESTSPEFSVASGEVVDITFRLDAEAMLLSPLTIEGRRGGDHGRDQFARRCASERAICLDPIHIALADPPLTSGYFRDIPGLVLDPNQGQMVRRLGDNCIVTFLNHQVWAFFTPVVNYPLPTVGLIGRNNPAAPRRGFRGAVNPRPGDNALDLRLGPGAVRAVEIYLDPDDIPEEIWDSPRAWDLWPLNSMQRCGAIIIWTHDQW